MEIERKFLVKSLPDNLESYPHEELSQAYIASHGTTVRIRKADDRYLLTIKKKPAPSEDSKAAIVNVEIEEEIPKDLFERLAAHVETPFLTKTRYRIPCGKHVAELDIYHGVLEGLKTVEIEYASVEEAQDTPVPSWFGRDVSNDCRYRNSSLSVLTTLEGLPLQ